MMENMNNMTKSGSDHVHILVVDDQKLIRKLLQRRINCAGYACSIASDGAAALKILEEKNVDVVITDIVMPGLNGIELTEIIKKKHDSDVIVMTGFAENLAYEEVIAKGASDFLPKPVAAKELLVRLERVLRERATLDGLIRAEEEVNQSLKKLKRALDETVRALASALGKRDPYTAGHQQRVAKLASAIAGELDLSEKQSDGIRIAGLLHDIGKISLPSEILSKPSRLTDIEFNLIKTHPEAGYEILKNIEFPWPIANIVLQHHERMDCSGYPQGLSGEKIILEARVLAVADVVEAMASHRPYRPSFGINKALKEISTKKGVLYDPEVVDACLKIFSENSFKFG